jgi:putative MATE family efflux protein
MVYNMGAGILRAVGDSQRPFYFLVICALLNTVLDLVFVAGFRWGAAGASLATVISQCVSAVLVVTLLLRSKGVIRLEIKKLKIHTDVLKKVLRVGVPSALQMAVTAFSNVFVQSYITYFDRGLPSSYYMSGWTSYLKVDQLLFLPVQSIALATTTFVGQNLGSNQPKRAKEGVRSALLLSIATTVAIMIPVMIFAPDIVGFLNPEPEVIKTGAMFLRLLTPFFIFHGFNQIYACALRGAGNSKIPMIMMLTSFVLFRQIYLFVMSRVCNEVVAIALGYPAGWILCTLLTGIYYHTTRLEKSRLVE